LTDKWSKLQLRTTCPLATSDDDKITTTNKYLWGKNQFCCLESDTKISRLPLVHF
jgi:hypothetical protein